MDTAKTVKSIKRIVVIALVLLLLFLGAYIYSLSKVEFRKITINDLQYVNLTGFSLGGDIELYNGGIIPVSVNNITYSIVLEDSGKELGGGIIYGRLINPKQTKNFSFSNRVNWVPTVEVALGLITPGKTYARLQGTIYIADLGFTEIEVPFEERIDLKEYLKQFANKKIEDVVNKVVNTATSAVDKIASGIATILES